MMKFFAAFATLILFPGVACLRAQNNAPVQAIAPENQTLQWHWDFFGPVQIADLDTLRQKALDSGDTNAEEALYKAFCNQADTLHFNLSDDTYIRKYIADAEILANATYYRPGNSLLFEAMADYMLGRLTDTLKYAINAGLVDKLDPAVIYIIQRLADNHKYIDIRVSNLAKTFTYLREGRFRYVFHKLTTTYKAELFRFLGALVLLIALFCYRKRISNALKTRLNRIRTT